MDFPLGTRKYYRLEAICARTANSFSVIDTFDLAAAKINFEKKLKARSWTLSLAYFRNFQNLFLQQQHEMCRSPRKNLPFAHRSLLTDSIYACLEENPIPDRSGLFYKLANASTKWRLRHHHEGLKLQNFIKRTKAFDDFS